MDKIDIRDQILRTLKDNKTEVDNFNDAVFEDDFLKVAETVVENLPIPVVMQRSELLLFADYSESDKTSQTTDECVDNYLAQKSNSV